MTEGNFVDYVKLNVSSGKGGKALSIYIVKNSSPRVAQTEAMEVEEDM
jgi:hypothetical protein